MCSTTVLRSPPAAPTTATSSLASSRTWSRATGRCGDTGWNADSVGTPMVYPSRWRWRSGLASQVPPRLRRTESTGSTRPAEWRSSSIPSNGRSSRRGSGAGSISRTTTGRWIRSSWKPCGGSSSSSGKRGSSTRTSKCSRTRGVRPHHSRTLRRTSTIGTPKTPRSPFASPSWPAMRLPKQAMNSSSGPPHRGPSRATSP